MNEYALILIVIFVILLIVHFTLRIRILGAYRKLQRAKIDFPMMLAFSKEKLESQVIPRFPNQANEIRNFGKKLRQSLRLVAILVLFAIVLFIYLYFNRAT